MQYDAETNIAMWELSQEPIASARMFGKLIVHFSAGGTPVIIEMLDASKFVSQTAKAGNPAPALG
ncbi:MAG: DUF2283 domain-containing protein [Candidatus Falkowbacteria bacterium]